MQWIWIIVALVTLVVELITVGNLISIWFFVGAVAALIIQLLRFDFMVQFLVFALFSVLSLLLIRPLTTRYFRGNTIATNADRVIGQRIRLQSAITSEKWGTLSYNGSIWSVIEMNQQSLAQGTLVEVIAIEGVKLIVKEVKGEV